ncbi:8322_t:CDS:2 [Cetraspora pellucida]|uniref:8322_t:CDS:1 n=1 Tax=Cetraspora pellucida TaxID=1433469 RepID=A0ACA9LRJ3_9GLOM|nr:8322_t:CDS:2 [Cetraspora pellucida]
MTLELENFVSQQVNNYGTKAKETAYKPVDYYQQRPIFHRGLFWIGVGQNHPSIDKRSYDDLIKDLKRQVQHYQTLYQKRVEKDLDKKDGGTQTDLSDRQVNNLIGMLKGKLEQKNTELQTELAKIKQELSTKKDAISLTEKERKFLKIMESEIDLSINTKLVDYQKEIYGQEVNKTEEEIEKDVNLTDFKAENEKEVEEEKIIQNYSKTVKLSIMRTLNRINKKVLTSRQKEIQELQKTWEETKARLKKSKKKEDKLAADFLEANFIHPETGLITNKEFNYDAFGSTISRRSNYFENRIIIYQHKIYLNRHFLLSLMGYRLPTSHYLARAFTLEKLIETMAHEIAHCLVREFYLAADEHGEKHKEIKEVLEDYLQKEQIVELIEREIERR